MEGAVYVGGGSTGSGRGEMSDYVVFRYDLAKNEWTHLPPSIVTCYALVQFMGELVLIGGKELGGTVSGKVYCFKMDSKEWEEFLTPLTTPRMAPCVAATQSALAVGGGMITSAMSVVEIYSRDTSQWHKADPLPLPCTIASSVTIGNTWYILGGFLPGYQPSKAVLAVSLDSLTQKAMSSSDQESSVWKMIPETHFCGSTAASFGSHLLSVGGFDAKGHAGQAICVFVQSSNSWVRVTKLPVAREGCTAVELPHKQLFIVGGKDIKEKNTSTVFIGSLATQ